MHMPDTYLYLCMRVYVCAQAFDSRVCVCDVTSVTEIPQGNYAIDQPAVRDYVHPNGNDDDADDNDNDHDNDGGVDDGHDDDDDDDASNDVSNGWRHTHAHYTHTRTLAKGLTYGRELN